MYFDAFTYYEKSKDWEIEKRFSLVDITVSNGVITLAKAFKHKTLEERAAEFGGNLNLDGEYDWGEPVGREVW